MHSRILNISVYDRIMKISRVSAKDKLFPRVLIHIPQPPKELYILGNIEPLLEKAVVSIVGSRAVTPYGKQVTRQLSGELAKRGIAIVSGLALGVDALAHEGALEVGGYTVAVLPSSLEEIYPATNRGLAARILKQGGALISEYPAVSNIAFKTNFIERNRIVSGLCDGLLITEASERSGTMHTANFALEQGKTVMAVPGNITSSVSKGTNNLIKTGAVPITGVEDILHALNINQQATLLEVIAANKEEAAILAGLKQGITDINALQVMSQLPPEAFNQTITMLEISGKIRSLGGGHWGIL